MEIDARISIKTKGFGSEFYTTETTLSETATLKELLAWTKQALVQISIDALRREQEKGFDKSPIVVVDGKKNKTVLDVSPLGKIQFIAKVQGNELITETYNSIMIRSKVVTGTYIEGNFVFYNGKVVATNPVELKSWLDTKPEFSKGDIIRFANVVPYARKLERYGVRAGVTRPRKTKSKDEKQRSGPLILAPNGAYFLTFRSISRKYKQNADRMKFEFILGSTLGVQNVPAISKNGKALRRNYKPSSSKPKNSGPYLYPSIKIVIGESGII